MRVVEPWRMAGIILFCLLAYDYAALIVGSFRRFALLGLDHYHGVAGE
jgi:hypothetical protein